MVTGFSLNDDLQQNEKFSQRIDEIEEVVQVLTATVAHSKKTCMYLINFNDNNKGDGELFQVLSTAPDLWKDPPPNQKLSVTPPKLWDAEEV